VLLATQDAHAGQVGGFHRLRGGDSAHQGAELQVLEVVGARLGDRAGDHNLLRVGARHHESVAGLQLHIVPQVTATPQGLQVHRDDLAVRAGHPGHT